MKDLETQEEEWVPAKVSSLVLSEGGTVDKFVVHIVVERKHERGIWHDEYRPGAFLCARASFSAILEAPPLCSTVCVPQFAGLGSLGSIAGGLARLGQAQGPRPKARAFDHAWSGVWVDAASGAVAQASDKQ